MSALRAAPLKGLRRWPSRVRDWFRGQWEWVVAVQRSMPPRNRRLLGVLGLIVLSPYTAPVAMWGVAGFAILRTMQAARKSSRGCLHALVFVFTDALKRSRLFLPGLVLAVSSILGAIVYGNMDSILITFLVLFPVFLAMLWLERTWGRDDAMHFSHFTSLLILPVAFVAFVRLAGFFPADFLDRAEGTFGNPNVLAFALEALIPMAMAMAYHVWSRHGKTLLILSIAVGWVLLYFTGSRSGLLAALAGTAVFFLCMSERRLLSFGLGLAALGLVVIAIWPDPVMELLKAIIPREPTMAAEVHSRIALWGFAWAEILKDPVLGRGFYSFQRYVTDPGYADRVHAHSLYLGLWLEAGGIGLMAFMAMVGRIAVSAVRTLRGSAVRPYLSGGLAVLTALLVHGVTDMPLMNTQALALIALTMAAMSVALGPKPARRGI